MRKGYELLEGKITASDAAASAISVFINPDETEKRHLIDELKIDEHTLNSALDPDELSRLEFEPHHTALIFKRPKKYSSQDSLLFRVASTGVFLFKDRLIIVLSEEVPLFDSSKQLARCSSLTEVMIKLIYRSIYHFLEHLKIINALSDELEQKIHTSLENRYLLNLFTLEKSLVYYLNAIHANGVLLEKLKNSASKLGFTAEVAEILDDLGVENNQCYKQAEIYSNILASLMDARASIVSNNLNVLMKTLNIITIGIMVPTFVVSAFSMNVAIPFSHHSYAFWIIMLLAVVSVVGFMIFWKFHGSGDSGPKYPARRV